jgi:hypothetical protein
MYLAALSGRMSLMDSSFCFLQLHLLVFASEPLAESVDPADALDPLVARDGRRPRHEIVRERQITDSLGASNLRKFTLRFLFMAGANKTVKTKPKPAKKKPVANTTPAKKKPVAKRAQAKPTPKKEPVGKLKPRRKPLGQVGGSFFDFLKPTVKLYGGRRDGRDVCETIDGEYVKDAPC